MSENTPKPKNKRPRKSRKSTRPSPWAPSKIPTGIPLTVAVRLLRDAGVEGLASASSLRKAFHEGKIPGTIRKKYGRSKPGDAYSRIYFDPGPIYDLIGAKIAAKTKETTIDQALVQYFEESPEHNPITALADKIAPTLGIAKKVFLEWHACKTNPFVMASEALRQERTRRAALDEAASDPDAARCRACKRLPEQARTESAKIVLNVTGETRAAFDIAEEIQLGEFSTHRCPECWSWLPSAPEDAMRARLQDLPAAEASHSVTEATAARNTSVSPTPTPIPDGRTSDGVVPAGGSETTPQRRPEPAPDHLGPITPNASPGG